MFDYQMVHVEYVQTTKTMSCWIVQMDLFTARRTRRWKPCVSCKGLSHGVVFSTLIFSEELSQNGNKSKFRIWTLELHNLAIRKRPRSLSSGEGEDSLWRWVPNSATGLMVETLRQTFWSLKAIAKQVSCGVASWPSRHQSLWPKLLSGISLGNSEVSARLSAVIACAMEGVRKSGETIKASALFVTFHWKCRRTAWAAAVMASFCSL